MKDYYYILGLESNCTLDEIKEAYRKLSKKLHPDLNQGDEYFEGRFRDIKDAWETLRDPVKRSQYDYGLKKLHSNPTNEEIKKGQYYRQQAENLRRREKVKIRRDDSLKFSHFKRKGPGVGMTITIIIIAFILSDYVIRWTGIPKAPKIEKTAEVSNVVSPVVKKHKRKHILKVKTAGESFKKNFDTARISPVTPEPVKPLPVKPEPVKAGPINPQPVKPLPVAYTASQAAATVNHTNKDYLYATYVLPNVTGVINMRAYNQFSSKIVTLIPAKAKVLVLEKGDIYYRVFFNNYIGYVPKWSLQAK